MLNQFKTPFFCICNAEVENMSICNAKTSNCCCVINGKFVVHLRQFVFVVFSIPAPPISFSVFPTPFSPLNWGRCCNMVITSFWTKNRHYWHFLVVNSWSVENIYYFCITNNCQ